jgi:septum formation topological specificity factor MinE
MTQEDRLDILLAAARDTGLSLDYLEALTRDLSRQACLRVIGKVSSLPMYRKSNDRP